MTTSQANINTNLQGNNSRNMSNGDSGVATASTNLESSKHNGLNTINTIRGTIDEGVTTTNINANEVYRRRKLNSRGSSIGSNSGCGGYSKDHLDAWLETCLKDASTMQLSSSSEFLDYNPTSSHTKQTKTTTVATTITATSISNLNYRNNHDQTNTIQSRPQLPFSYPYNSNSINMNLQPQPQQQQQPISFKTNLPFGNSSNQNKNFSTFPKPSPYFSNRYLMTHPLMNANDNINGGEDGITYNNNYRQTDYSHDFSSLPPMVNTMRNGGNYGDLGAGGNLSEFENNSTGIPDISNSNPNISRSFRFSDPCLLNPSDNEQNITPEILNKNNNLTQNIDDNTLKFFTVLMKQIQLLHETNSKICRNLHETKVDIEALKHVPSWGFKHRRDSISGLSTHSQPMIFGGAQSPAPTQHSGAYTPGMMTDVVREVKEAARIREDALLNRVKAMVEERQWSLNETNLRLIRDLEEVEIQIHQMRVERKEINKRLNHLEAENKYMRQILVSLFNNRHMGPNVIYENETLRSPRKIYHCRRTSPLNMNYNSHNQQSKSAKVVQQDINLIPLHINELDNIIEMPPAMHNSYSSSDGGGGGNEDSGSNVVIGDDNRKPGPVISPPNFALISEPNDDVNRTKDNTSKQHMDNCRKEEVIDTFQNTITNATIEELRQELNNAVAARNNVDERIIALTKMVKTLRFNGTSTKSSNSTNCPTPHNSTIRNTISNDPKLSKQQSQVINNSCDTIASATPKNGDVPTNSTKRSDNTFTGIHMDNRRKCLQKSTIYSPTTESTPKLVPAKLSVTGPITDL